MNLQAIEKQDLRDGRDIAIHSIFHTLQGEGPFAGEPAVFVRLGGCNLQCPGCDTDYTLDVARMTVIGVMSRIRMERDKATREPALPLVVLTGGEPFRQNIEPLVHELLSNGYGVQIETNGTLYVELGDAWHHEYLHVVCSPKTGRLNADLLPHITAYKYILDYDHVDPDDGLPIFALEHGANPRVARPPPLDEVEVFVQPRDEKNEERNTLNLAAATRSCLRYGYRLSVQLHKLAGLE